MMKIRAIIILVFFSLAGQSQNTINSYKFVLVPRKFDSFKAEDEFGMNSMTKLLLEQKGFVVLWSNEDLPQTVVANKCTALAAEVSQRSTMFTTNLTVQLKDCMGNIIFKSKEGKSREKEYTAAYNEALKDAFSSLDKIPYKYDSTALTQTPPSGATPAASPPAPVTTPHTVADIHGTLYAQVIPSGYQLIDTTPKKVLTLLKTSMPDCYLADAGAGASNGIVFKKNNEWFFEYYKDGSLVSQKLEVKF